MPNELQGLLMPKKKGNALQELAQGVSKGFWADGLGGPVDLITTLANLGIAGAGYAGHKSGLLSQPIPLIEKPVGGSDWIAEKMRSAGILGDNPGSTADNYGRVLGGLLAPVVQAKAPQIASAANAAPAVAKAGAYALGERGAQMMENQLVKQGGILPATVWHGSPHKFDKFDASKIGTGEGAQAYGHGLYLAESPDVAQSYAQSVKANTGELVKRGAAHGLPEDVASNLAAALQSGKSFDPVLDAARKMIDNPLVPAPQRQAAQRLLDHEMPAYNAWSEWSKPGQVYKVDLPDDAIAKMLDWDKPLSQQAPEVQKAVSPMFGPTAADLTGQEIYKKAAGFDSMVNVASKTGGNAARLKTVFPQATDAQIAQAIAAAKNAGSNDRIAAQMLRDAGIPGIRYLDGGSRGAGQGSSNFVVFPGNEGLLSILERNGQPLR